MLRAFFRERRWPNSVNTATPRSVAVLLLAPFWCRSVAKAVNTATPRVVAVLFG